jgi:LEA14-like dessication related protein
MKRSALAFPLFAVLACSKPEPPTITPKSAEVTGITPAGVDMKVSLEVKNPNGFDISARKMTAKLTLDRYDLGNVSSPSAITIPAKGSTTFDTPVSMKWNDIAPIAAVAATQADVPYKVDGTVTLGGERVNFDVPFHLEGKIPHDQIVKATLQSLPKIPGLTMPVAPPK